MIWLHHAWSSKNQVQPTTTQSQTPPTTPASPKAPAKASQDFSWKDRKISVSTKVSVFFGIYQLFHRIASALAKTGDTPLQSACKEGDNQTVFALLKDNANVHQANRKGDTALHIACRMGNIDVVKALLSSNQELNKKNKAGDTPLHIACRNGNIDVVKALLSSKPELNKKNKAGDTPLHIACKKGNLEIVTVLIESGASLSETDMEKDTPLHVACNNGATSIVQLLLGNKAPKDAKNNDSNTPLNVAAIAGHLEIFNLLYEKDSINVEHEDNKKTLLFLAVDGQNENIVKRILEDEPDKKALDMYKKNPLHYAVQLGSFDICQQLVYYGIDVNAQTLVVKDNGETLKDFTPLMAAAQTKNLNDYSTLPIVEMLVNHGADVNTKDQDNSTAVHYAAQSGKESVINYLTAEGAEVDLIDKLGNAPIHYAAQHGHLNVVQSLINKNADITKVDGEGKSILHYAAMKGWNELIDEHITEFDVNLKDTYGKTPLHYAVEYQNLEVVKLLLLQVGIEVDEVDEKQQTPLHIAAKLRFEEKAEKKRDTKKLNKDNRIRNNEIIQQLLIFGADSKMEDEKKKTPRNYADYSTAFDMMTFRSKSVVTPVKSKGKK